MFNRPPHTEIPTLPDGAVFSLGRTLTDGDHIENLSLPRSALGTFGKAHLTFGARMRGQLLFEHPS
ncbi:hypothetical protein WH91_19820 [Devosia psychrophila]|uniref:Uncharacterized protein n=1 Tax=Devosia psychrophila TaxID=728005 RepID=A0ABR5DTN7_9HYPH|nr:hypothetical protein WH91_19820 [Devosia psychrophila]